MEKLGIAGNENIGVYLTATDAYLLAPSEIKPSALMAAERTLRVHAHMITVAGTQIIGTFVAANSHGVVFPYIARESEYARLSESLNIAVSSDACTALGNLVLANDYGAIASPRLKPETLKILGETLEVKVVTGTIAGSHLVGSFAVCTNEGALVHPMSSEDERKLIEEVLGVEAWGGTVNEGVPYVRTGLVANANGALVGYKTTGPEVMTVEMAFNLARGEAVEG